MKDSLSLDIVNRISDKEGTDPTDITPPLHSTIDTDALEKLFHDDVNADSDAKVEFSYLEYRVAIYGSGEIEVSELDSTDDDNHP